MRFRTAIGLSITARCPIRCAHCIVEADRRRTEQMEIGGARALLDAAARSHGRRADAPRMAVAFVTGGEPFFAPELLRATLLRAGELGLATVVVTNAFWATNARRALETLRSFPGIDVLTISTDRYHRAFVGLNRIRHAVAAARQLAIPLGVAVCGDGPAELAAEQKLLAGIVEEDEVLPALTLPAGRSAGRTRSLRPVAGPGRCEGADVPLVFPDGRVIACMGMVGGLGPAHPLLLGDAWRTPLEQLLESAERNVFLHAMRALGPYAFTGGPPDGAPLTIPRRFRAYGRCALCYAMAAEPAICSEVRRRAEEPTFTRLVAEARASLLHESMPARGAGHERGSTGAPPRGGSPLEGVDGC